MAMMSDRYLEQYFTDEAKAIEELAQLRKNYAVAGYYKAAEGFLVWADREELIP